jgi:hypothetical protein
MCSRPQVADIPVWQDNPEFGKVVPLALNSFFKVLFGLRAIIRMYGTNPLGRSYFTIRGSGGVEPVHLQIPEYLIGPCIVFPNADLRCVERQLQPAENILKFLL